MLDYPGSWSAMAQARQAELERYLRQAAMERLALEALPRTRLFAQVAQWLRRPPVPAPAAVAAPAAGAGQNPCPCAC